jgi:hypothetical protein
MVVSGHVQNGVIVLDDGVRLADGQEVTVVVPDSAAADRQMEEVSGTHSVLDVPPVSVGAVLHPLASDDDLLGEMLEGRR